MASTQRPTVSYFAAGLCVLTGVFAPVVADAADAPNPALDCRSPKAPDGYTVFGIGRASLNQHGSQAAARDAAAKASHADLVGRLCADGCGCSGVGPVQPYSFGQEGDEICHISLLPDADVQRFLAARSPERLRTAVSAALMAVWPRSEPAARPPIALAAQGGAASWLRGLAGEVLSSRANVRQVPDCVAARAMPMGLCLTLAPPKAGASDRLLTIDVTCTGPSCRPATLSISLDACALAAATGMLVCPDDGDPAGDHCEARGGDIPACTRNPMGGAGVWASAEVAGSDEKALTAARAEALRRAVAPIVGVTVGGRDQALEARLRATDLAEFTAFRCRPAAGRVRVDVFVPERERQRLLRGRRDATLAVLWCQSNPAAACSSDLRDRVRALAQDAGLQVSDVMAAATDPTSAELNALGANAEAAQVLVVRLSAAYVGLEKPYHHCRAQLAATLYDVSTGKGVKEARPTGYGSDGGFKGLVFADHKKPADACKAAILKGWEELRAAATAWGSGVAGADAP